MDVYKIFIKTSAKKELKNIPKNHLKKIMEKIEPLAKNPRPNGVVKLSYEEKYRIHQGDYRIIYSIKDHELIIFVVKGAHRKNVYRSC